MLNTFRARSNCGQEAKFVQDRILAVEKTIAELCYVFAEYSRKAARLRDKGDEIAKISLAHAEAETINKSLSIALENFADSISLLSSYGDLRVKNLDHKVIKELSQYEDICKRAKDDVKQIYNAREREIARKRQLDRIKERNPQNRQQIIQAETELVKATAEFSKTLRNLEEKSAEFEKQKLHDIKSIILDFISVEMGYHAKSLEVLTKAFQNINAIDEESDLLDFQKISRKVDAEFKRSLRKPDISHVNSRGLFRTTNSLGSLGTLFSTGHRKSEGIPKAISKSEETLDSMKPTFSDSEESLSDTINNISENLSETDDKSSPVLVRKHKKK